MPVRSVQISIDEELLRAIDRRKETRREGRSATIRRAIRLYLELARRREIDQAYARAYGEGTADAIHDELVDVIRSQSWPDE